MHPLIKSFIPTAELIQKSFGSHCEVVLHDITTPQNSVVYVTGSVTDRQVGQSFDHLITQVILSKDFKDDLTANYFFTAQNGKPIKSSTALIRDANGEVVGAVCLNIDISLANAAFLNLQEFLGKAEIQNTQKKSENEPDNVMKILENLIDKIISKNNNKKLKKDEKKELVAFMDKKGVFAIKGAIDMVAARLGVSKVTIYGYIDEIKKA
ncbi:PAS domain-containing protein [Campylobacter sp. faydin G-140]|uniref:helix-turn-helix transcriptional regulator n=1 Tax=Campylobacter anatolicus TaxID=2829105 RepID=UPI001BA2FE72|nr:PAS domain-containing protein [Campylobacter anatolicus]MBR8464838.1 PAS domain-containing protein [Campylobacter anatolicus]